MTVKQTTFVSLKNAHRLSEKLNAHILEIQNNLRVNEDIDLTNIADQFSFQTGEVLIQECQSLIDQADSAFAEKFAKLEAAFNLEAKLRDLIFQANADIRLNETLSKRRITQNQLSIVQSALATAKQKVGTKVNALHLKNMLASYDRAMSFNKKDTAASQVAVPSLFVSYQPNSELVVNFLEAKRKGLVRELEKLNDEVQAKNHNHKIEIPSEILTVLGLDEDC